MTDRLLEDSDLSLLELSLSKDEYHKTTTVDFFTEPGTITKVYEDEKGPILFARGAAVLRLDIQYVDNSDTERNKAAMLEGFAALAQKAKENGFKEVIFSSKSRALRVFVRRHFKFDESPEEMRLYL